MAEQKSLVPARPPQRTNQGMSPYQLYSLSPHSPQFQQSAWVTHVLSLCYYGPWQILYQHHSREDSLVVHKARTYKKNHWIMLTMQNSNTKFRRIHLCPCCLGNLVHIITIFQLFPLGNVSSFQGLRLRNII
jgi:hypothetical protein